MAGALLVYGAGKLSARTRALAAVLISLAATVLVAIMWPMVSRGAVEYGLPGLLGIGVFLRLDLFGFALALVAAILWLLATIYSTWYMENSHAQVRYYPFCMFTLGATLGVFMSGDLFTFFVFFELMTVAFYVLAVHDQSQVALQAGNTYLYMGISGGLCVLLGIFLLAGATGSTAFEPQLEAVLAAGANPALIAAFLVAGFGAKAGMVPLHIWLPQVYPVAPSPCSALCSGIMIKTGVYGIMRVLLTVLRPAAQSGELWRFAEHIGLAVLWLGLLTMAMGAVLAALQNNVNRILAYSSVSQIGYILTGVGAAVYLGIEGGMGFSGAFYHVINHAFFKAGLFLMFGAVCLATGESGLDRMGGLARKFPVTAAAVLVAAAAIAGIPAFSGYASKTLIHDALIEAYQHHPTALNWLAEKFFVVASAGTVVYFTRMYRGVFLGRIPRHLEDTPGESWLVRSILAVFAGSVLAVGLFPNFLLERLIVPAAYAQGFAGQALKHLEHFHYWEWHPVSAILTSLGLGIVLYTVSAWRKWMHLDYPAYLSVEGMVVLPTIRVLDMLGRLTARTLDRGVDNSYHRMASSLGHLMERIGVFDRALDEGYSRVGETSRDAVGRMLGLEEAVDGAYQGLTRASMGMVKGAGDIDDGINRLREELTGANKLGLAREGRAGHQGDDARLGVREARWLTSVNFSVNALVVAIMLMTLLFVLVFYGVTRW